MRTRLTDLPIGGQANVRDGLDIEYEVGDAVAVRIGARERLDKSIEEAGNHGERGVTEDGRSESAIAFPGQHEDSGREGAGAEKVEAAVAIEIAGDDLAGLAAGRSVLDPRAEGAIAGAEENGDGTDRGIRDGEIEMAVVVEITGNGGKRSGRGGKNNALVQRRSRGRGSAGGQEEKGCAEGRDPGTMHLSMVQSLGTYR